MTALQITWFLLVGVLFTGYVVLDGFDLGAATWNLFEKDPERRRLVADSLGPFWDGNEVWLLTGGGALFAAFPHVYATVFSGMYLALLLVLLCLILRAVAIEFRHQVQAPRWQAAWDKVLGLGSALPALLLGVALGNVLVGLPLDGARTFTGNFFTLLNPYSLLLGAAGLALLAAHGALYLAWREPQALGPSAGRRALLSWGVFVTLLLAAMVWTVLGQPRLLDNYRNLPLLYLLPLAGLGTALASGGLLRRGRVGGAFLCTAATIILLMATCGAGLYPDLVPARPDPALSLTIFNASSSELTLTVMLVLALLGMPLVLGYTAWQYRTMMRPLPTPAAVVPENGDEGSPESTSS